MNDKEAVNSLMEKFSERGCIFVLGDLVTTKHVEHEIGYVEAGGIGVQVNNGGEQGVAPPRATGEKSKGGSSMGVRGLKIVDGSFFYKWVTQNSARLIMLYQVLLKLKLIDQRTTPEDFEALFIGKSTDVRIRWTGPKSVLKYFVELLVNQKQYVTLVGGKIWEITQSRFVDAKGREFVNLKGEHKPERYAAVVERIVELLNPHTELPELNLMDDDPEQELWAGIKDRGWEGVNC